MMILALLGSLPVVTLGHALQRLFVPATLVHLMLFTVRYLDVVGKEYERLRRAMTARAFQLRPDRHTKQRLGFSHCYRLAGKAWCLFRTTTFFGSGSLPVS
jgi:cobalt/nickel transport system permease protein